MGNLIVDDTKLIFDCISYMVRVYSLTDGIFMSRFVHLPPPYNFVSEPLSPNLSATPISLINYGSIYYLSKLRIEDCDEHLSRLPCMISSLCASE